MAKRKTEDAGTNGATATTEAPREKKPRERKRVIIMGIDGNGNWQDDGEEIFPNAGEAEAFLAKRGTPGRYRILTIQRELTVREETVKKVVLE